MNKRLAEYNGLKVFVQPELQKLKLFQDVQVTSDFRKEFNGWLANGFGCYSVIPDEEIVIHKHRGAAQMNGRTYEIMKPHISGLAEGMTYDQENGDI